jgi:anhydro-N-acetylmuramic acid kinase
MSGTSADAVDAALVRMGASPQELETIAHASTPLNEDLRRRIHGATQGALPLRELLRLDVELGRCFADAAIALLRQAGVAADQVEGIGSHGQTLAHHPEPDVRGSLQVGSPAVLHALTGIPVVSDFRSADLAAGGQGAPLTPFLHRACFSEPGLARAVLNIGGFTNLTWLGGSDAAPLVAFDPGPGNALLDRAARWASGGADRFDRDGAGASRGRVNDRALERLLADTYFRLPPPKSTGHEYFDAGFFEQARDAVRADGGSADDVLATLMALTVESVVRAAEAFFPEPARHWLVYGGGVHNAALMNGLMQRLAPVPVETTAAAGVDPDALEAVAFALLGWCAARGRPSNVPEATGARCEARLGSLTPPDAFRAR